MTGRVHSIETMGAVDGPGLRFVLFLQGCPLRCRYCHNPDTWDPRGGRETESSAVLAEVKKYRHYFGRQGGVTVSGGEPLAQLDFLLELFAQLRAEGIHTALDTSGALYEESDERYTRLLSLTDLVLLDIKHIDPEVCRRLTGRDNRAELAFARRCAREGVPLWIRQVLLPGWTDGEDDLLATRRFLDGLGSAVRRREVLPYHTMGKEKYKRLGIPYPLEGVPVPGADDILRAKQDLGAE